MTHKINSYSLDLKLRVVNAHLNLHYSISKIVDLFLVSKSSVYNWVSLYKQNLLTSKLHYTKPLSIIYNSNVHDIIKNYISTSYYFDYKFLISLIHTNTSYLISKSTLFNIIHFLKFSKKIIKTKKVYKNSQEQFTNKLNLLTSSFKNINLNNVISIDESSFDTNIINNYSWSLKNSPIYKQINATYKRLTLICAISNSKVISYKLINGSSNATHFTDFIKSIPNLSSKILFMDNARIHHSKIFKTYVIDNNLNVIYNIPYAPELNPIEIIFSQLKAHVKRFQNNFNFNSLKNNITNSLEHIAPNILSNSFTFSFNKILHKTHNKTT